MNSPTDFDVNRRPVQEQYEDDEIDLLQYWSIVNRNKWGILGLVGVVIVFAIVVVFSLTPVFEATATLLIESKEANVVSIEEIYGIDSSQREYYQTQFEILNSRQLAEQVINKLDIRHHPEYNPDIKQSAFSWRRFIPFLPPTEAMEEGQVRAGIISHFQQNLIIEPIRNTQLVKIHFESTDPDLTYKVANEVGDSYIESNLDARIQLTQKAADWLTGRLGGMREKLQLSEQALQAYREREDLVDISGVETLAAKELDEITRRLVDARNKTSEAKTQFDDVVGNSTRFDSAWETLPVVLKDSLAQQLKENEEEANNQFSELKQRYGPKHPKYISAKSQLQSSETAYRSRIQKVVSGLKKEYQQALTDQQALGKSLATTRKQTQELNRKRYELRELEREAQTNRQLYDMFFKRFRETDETDFAAANARFVDIGVKPYQPIKPKKALIVALSAFVTLILGIALAFLKETLDNTVRTPEEVEEKLNQPLVGVLPLEKTVADDGISSATLYMQGGHSQFSESVRSLRTSLVLSGLDKPHKITVITSSVPGEGKTTLCSNLVLALGQMEKVVLVDADMRRPSLAKAFDLPEGSNGLAELIAQTETQSDCIHHLPDCHIDLIPSGALPPNPLDLLSSLRFASLIQTLSEKYDRILIDSAPMQLVSDALVLSKYADALIYLIKSDSTPVNVVQNGLKRLHQVNAPLIGVVLNQFDAEAASKGGYSGGNYYSYGYSSQTYT